MATDNNNKRVFIETLANVFLQDHKVKVFDNSNILACCDVEKKKMWFDLNKIFESQDPADLFKQMMVFKGLGFHEIMHLKFTGRSKSVVGSSQTFVRLLGQLEDGRIETLGVMLHEKMADYFISAVNKFLIEDKKPILENKDNWLLFAYILLYGRSIYFQDRELLTLMREMIIKTYGRDTAEIVEETINAYIPENSIEVRFALCSKLHEFLLVKNILPMDMKGMNMSLSHIMDTKKDESERNMDDDLKTLTQDFPQLSEALENVSKELESKTQDVKDDKKGREKAKKDKENQIAKLNEKRDEIVKKIYDSTDSNERVALRQKAEEKLDEIDALRGKGFSPTGIDSDIDKLGEMIEEKEEEQEELVEAHKDDLVEDLKSIGYEGEIFADGSFTVTPEMRLRAKELENNLCKMNNELAKGYQPKNKSGRLNVRSLLNRKSQVDFKIFNRYTPDKLKLTKALVNIYIDGSGSMSSDKNWDKALNTLWVLNEALNRDENKVMIYQFSSYGAMVKGYDKILTIPQMMGGGTEPSSAILPSIPIIEAYRKSKNFTFVVDVIITDGEFGDDQDPAFQKLNELGHHTILIRVGGYARYSDHKAKHSLNLTNFDELVGSMSNIFIDIKKGLFARLKV